MSIRIASALLLAALCAPDILYACGDKFLLVGRGARFQKAYAAIHPAAILIVLPSKSVKNAAVRDSRLRTALKMAGHRVEVLQQPANLAEVLSRSRPDIILAERADASVIPDVGGGGQPKPTVIAVLEEPSSSELASASQQFEGVLKTPQPLSQILNLLDDVMKKRLGKARA
jgi:hypothetical protein